VTDRTKLAQVDPPRALDLRKFQFNFRVGVGARVGALHGAPAFSQRTKNLERRLKQFWDDLELRHAELWGAAGEGRIDDEGREVRQSLLTSAGADPIGRRDHRKRLFSARLDEDRQQCIAFNRAWDRHLERCGLQELQDKVADYCKWFPIEANLMSDPTTGDYIWSGRPWVPPVAPTLDDVLARFPRA